MGTCIGVFSRGHLIRPAEPWLITLHHDSGYTCYTHAVFRFNRLSDPSQILRTFLLLKFELQEVFQIVELQFVKEF
jgi:hypothetical protein